MADFTLNGPGTTNNPWTPANVIIPVSSLQSDATGWRPSSGTYTAAAHDATYNPASIDATVKIAAISSNDDVLIGSIVRSGANAGGFIGCKVIVSASLVQVCSYTPAGLATPISTNSSLPTSVSINDVYDATVSISGGTATITFKQNGTSVGFNINTTTTYTSEVSLAAGHAFDPQNVNGTKLSQFAGTGVSGNAFPPIPSPSLQISQMMSLLAR